MKKINRKLSLSTETIKAIGGGALADAAGGMIPVSRFGNCSWVDDCPSRIDPTCTGGTSFRQFTICGCTG